MGTGNISVDAEDGAEGDEPETGNPTSWSEMKRYSINFEEWMLKNQDSKIITKLPVPGYEPSSRKYEVVA